MEKIKVLVIDDKKIIGNFFGFTLGYSGHVVKCVHSAQEALDAVKQERFDIAFLDIVMPDKDGVSILKDIKHISPQLPIVMMSGYSVEGKRSEAKELGAVSSLKKPFELDEVRKVVREALGKEI